MKIVSVKTVGSKPVYDISIKSDDYDEQYYVLENGVMSHNSGSYYSADNIFIIGRQQEKEGTEIVGYNFIINIEKSRYVREKSKIPVTVSFDGGISRWSGLLDLALESGHVIKPTNGWYSKVDKETGEIENKKYRIKDTDTKEFWTPILNQESFTKFVSDKYSVSTENIMGVHDD